MIQEFFFPCLWAFLASVAFGLVYNIHGGGILICGLGGALGWFVYLAVQLLPIGSIPAAFAAAAAIAVFSCWRCMQVWARYSRLFWPPSSSASIPR